MYYQGLPGRLKQHITTEGHKTGSLLEVMTAAHNSDMRYWEWTKEKTAYNQRRPQKPATATINTPTASSPNAVARTRIPANVPLTSDGKITATEKERRKANNLCLYCADPSHVTANCPQAPRGPKPAAKPTASGFKPRPTTTPSDAKGKARARATDLETIEVPSDEEFEVDDELKN
ncbi:hypothetical protein ONZ45_g13978 [Pleurotus djamor]|nr:hypothetical protein ONZ45_g13978 [Pleurotus djamor]